MNGLELKRNFQDIRQIIPSSIIIEPENDYEVLADAVFIMIFDNTNRIVFYQKAINSIQNVN
jgi:hypothetical protein